MLNLFQRDDSLNPEEEPTPIVNNRLYPKYTSAFSPEKPKKTVQTPKCLESALEIVPGNLINL